MNTIEQAQERLRATDPVKIARQWANSPFIYADGDSKGKRAPNPEYHPIICQTEDGKFVDVEGRRIPIAKVPAYIREEGKRPLAAAPAPSQRKVSLAEAMQEAEEREARANEPAPESIRRRTRKTKK